MRLHLLKPRLHVSLLSIVLMAGPSFATPSGNGIEIQELSGAAQTNRPFTISRIFKQGDIPNFPQAVVGGTPLTTQADVKTRWPDGSVQHVVLSFIASLSANQSATVNFQNQGSGNNTGELDRNGMLNINAGAWGGKIETTIGSADARAMLADAGLALSSDINSNQIRYWLKGPICTQVIVEDKSSVRAYDFGSDTNKSLHPIFVLTFYPGTSAGVKVEYILENAWTTKLQDQSYGLVLREGNPATNSIYTKSAFTHYAKTRWRKVYWSGADMDKTSGGAWRYKVDHNRPYMIASHVIPNYDPSKIPSASAISNAVSLFNATPDKGDINGNGQFLKDFGTTGGRPEIGLFPTWEGQYLATFDAGLYTVLLGNGGVSAHVPMHLRESNSSLSSYYGKPYSVSAHPTGGGTTSVGPIGATGWTVDVAHQASFAFIPYAITGDWFFMEEMQFWASSIADSSDPGTCSYCRNGSMGIITQPHQMRGLAWGLRNYAHAAFFTPDVDGFKSYYTNLLNYTLGAYEGKMGIDSGAFNGTPAWTFGRNVIAPNGDGGQIGRLPNPLGIVEYNSNCHPGNTSQVNSSVSYCDTPWQNNYFRVSLGHIIDLGFRGEKILETSGRELIHMATDPTFANHYLLGSYAIPRTRSSDNRWFQDWTSLYNGYADAEKTKTSWNAQAPSSDDFDCDNGYPQLARAAASFVTPYSDTGFSGQAAYDWLDTHVDKNCQSGNPKWAFLPRSAAPPPTQPLLLASPTSLAFTYTPGGTAPAAKTLQITNGGVGTLAWFLTTIGGAVWLAPSPAGGNTNNQTVTVTVNTSGLSAGVYNETLRFTDGAASNNPLDVPVTLTVLPPPNQPPTVATPASATPNPVTGLTTTLSVLGADDAGEPALSYTWSLTGTPPAPVTYSPSGRNGTNAAKSITATFTRAGAYNFLATITDAGGLTVTSPWAVTVNATVTSITVSPTPTTVQVNGTKQFAAAAQDQFTQTITPAPTFAWATNAGAAGSINSSGLFSAGPVAAGPFNVTASNGSITSNAAQITISANNPPAVILTSPADGATFTAPATVNLAASATPGTNPIARVEFYRGSTLIGTDTSSPYTFNWTNVPAGSYQITAVAYDNAATPLTDTSNVANIIVNTVNHAPSVGSVSASPPDVDTTASGVQEYEGTSVLYSASVSDQDNDAITWQWYYTYNGGSRIPYGAAGSAAGSATAQISFNYPIGTAGINYVWILSATDNKSAPVERQLAVAIIAQNTTGNTPPPPDLSSINNRTYTTQDSIQLPAAPSGAVISGYLWGFNKVGAVAGSNRAGILSRISSTNQATTSNSLGLGTLGLDPGSYDLSVQAQNGSLTSAASHARINVVSADFSTVKVFPNPWKKDKHNGRDIVFDNLTANSTVKIFTVSGHLVRELTGNGTVAWNLQNDKGDAVASGIYVYVVTDNSGNKKRGKLAIVR